MNKLILSLLVFVLAGSSCKKEKKTDCDFSSELQQLKDLENTYKSNPTAEYCEASKKFMLKLLNQAEDCPEANKQEIARVRQLIAAEGCSGLIPK